ncbi:MAG TPA: NAD-dependent succinate-semialdehyde dehydrogenase [Candidatus Dormibacteraeota bacterium]|nr:NAD-dependent succinate-semialdehyde dehydrogenase [Candidatus Dormibacteraeota bacterium]
MLKSIDPATGRELASFPELDEAGIDRTVGRAWSVRHEWRDAGLEIRTALLRSAAGVLRAEKPRFAALLTAEMGKPIVEAEAEIEKCAWTAGWFADNAARLLADEPIESNASESYVRFQPMGVVLAVMPWNFPFWQVLRAAVPAMAAGNVVLLKHSSNVPQSALAIEEMFREAGFPEGVFQTLLIGSGSLERIIDDERVAGVTLTGSDRSGAQLATAAGKALKKAVLELGGSDPFIVLADADINAAASVACRARNQNNGQSCIAAKRFIVEEAVADEFEGRFTAAVAGLKVGDPMDRSNQVGPLARADLVDDLERQVDESVRMGARPLVGGKRIAGSGNYFAPTVLTDVGSGMPVYREETFGPVAAVIRVRDPEEAVRVANDTAYGLGSNVWTGNVERGKRIAEHIEAGQVFINGMVASDARLPFGGVKRSGYGRELSGYGIKEFTNIQTIWVGPAKTDGQGTQSAPPRAD